MPTFAGFAEFVHAAEDLAVDQRTLNVMMAVIGQAKQHPVRPSVRTGGIAGRLRRFLWGPMGRLPRVNCWTLAEHAGESSPGGMQHFLAGAVWDDDRTRTRSATP